MPSSNTRSLQQQPSKTRRGRAKNAVTTQGVNKSTLRILRVLSEFAERPRGTFGITELSRRLGLTKNMVFRALATLINEGYVVRDPTGTRYALGYRVFELCTAEFEPPDIRTLCAPFVRRLHDLTGETVLLSIRVGDSSVVIDGIEGRGPLLSRVTHGRAIPLHAGPGSRAILSFLPDLEIQRYLETRSPLTRFTPTTIVDREALWSDIETVRERGYAVGYKDHLTGVLGVAFPVFDADGRVQGAISVGGPEDQMDNETIAAFVPAIRRIVEDLNRRSRLLHLGGENGHNF